MAFFSYLFLQKEVQGKPQKLLVIIQLLLPREMSDLEAVPAPFFLFRIMPVVLRSVQKTQSLCLAKENIFGMVQIYGQNLLSFCVFTKSRLTQRAKCVSTEKKQFSALSVMSGFLSEVCMSMFPGSNNCCVLYLCGVFQNAASQF